MTTVLLDTHVLHWWSAEPDRLSQRAAEAVSTASELAVAGITWYELAWLAGSRPHHPGDAHPHPRRVTVW